MRLAIPNTTHERSKRAVRRLALAELRRQLATLDELDAVLDGLTLDRLDDPLTHECFGRVAELRHLRDLATAATSVVTPTLATPIDEAALRVLCGAGIVGVVVLRWVDRTAARMRLMDPVIAVERAAENHAWIAHHFGRGRDGCFCPEEIAI